MNKSLQPEERCLLRLKEIRGAGQSVGEISAWLSGSSESRATFRIRTGYMAQIPQARWTEKMYRSIQGDLKEIKWKANNVQYRALGFWKDSFFVMVLGCTHKQKAYDPPGWKKTALKRITEVKNGQWTTIEFEHLKT